MITIDFYDLLKGANTMDFKELDDFLHSYTDHEREYLTKKKMSNEEIAYTPRKSNLKIFDFKKTSRFLSVTEHNHEYIEMNYVYSGEIKQVINNTEILLKKNDLIILDTQVRHSIAPPGKNDILLAFRFSKKYFTKIFFKDFNPDNPISDFLLKSLFESQKYNRYLFFPIQDEFELICILKLLVIELIEHEKTDESIYNHYITIIFEKLLKYYEKALVSNKESSKTKDTKLYFDILSFIEENHQNVTVKSMSQILNYSPNYLSSLIKKITGKNFSQLICEIRLKKAIILLESTNLPISEICEEVGFSNQNTFYTMFEKQFHTTPKKYRNMNKYN
ncbi:hypothetical protein RU94_GL002009 [Enterococcus asini]|nr:hypothetical protein RU94_GL002009 [Enterococcus asini]